MRFLSTHNLISQRGSVTSLRDPPYRTVATCQDDACQDDEDSTEECELCDQFESPIVPTLATTCQDDETAQRSVNWKICWKIWIIFFLWLWWL